MIGWSRLGERLTSAPGAMLPSRDMGESALGLVTERPDPPARRVVWPPRKERLHRIGRDRLLVGHIQWRQQQQCSHQRNSAGTCHHYSFFVRTRALLARLAGYWSRFPRHGAAHSARLISSRRRRHRHHAISTNSRRYSERDHRTTTPTRPTRRADIADRLGATVAQAPQLFAGRMILADSYGQRA